MMKTFLNKMKIYYYFCNFALPLTFYYAESVRIHNNTITPTPLVLYKPFVVTLEYEMEENEVFNEIRFNKIVADKEDFNIYYFMSSGHRYPSDMGLRVNLTLSNATQVYFSSAIPEDVGHYEWIIFGRGVIYGRHLFELPLYWSSLILSQTMSPKEPQVGSPLVIGIVYDLKEKDKFEEIRFSKIVNETKYSNVYFAQAAVKNSSGEMGKRVDLSKSNITHIAFTRLEPEDGGNYMLWLVYNKQNYKHPVNLKVYLPYTVGVNITGIRHFYKEGEILQGLCRSLTPISGSNITWTIDGEEVVSKLLTNETVIYNNRSYYNTTGTLHYKLKKVKNVNITCIAALNSFLMYKGSTTFIINAPQYGISLAGIAGIFVSMCILVIILGIASVLWFRHKRQVQKKSAAAKEQFETIPTTEI